MPDNSLGDSEYKPIFGLDVQKDGKRKPVPKWIPITLLAFSTAAMVLPVIMLRRYRAANLGKALAEAPPPPPRRTTSLKGTPVASLTPNQSVFSIRDALPTSPSSSTSSVATKAEDNFNGALHCAKAFTIATLLVGAGATVTAVGVQQYMGVSTTQEFADRMRMAILTRMPVLSARIYRQPEPEDGDALLPSEDSSDAIPSGSPPLASTREEWSWPAAERRLREAFDKHGFYGWAAAAMKELEAEGQLERTKRGHL